MRKYLLLLCSIMLFTPFVQGQRTGKKAYKKKTVKYPTIPMKDVSSVQWMLYYPTASVTQDTLMKYLGNVKGLEKEAGKFPYFSYKSIMMVNGNADIKIEVAMGQTRIGEKRLAQDDLGYFYWVDYQLPTYVKFSDKSGKTLDILKINTTDSLHYGSERIKTQTGGTIEIGTLAFASEDDLALHYNSFGAVGIEKKAVVNQLGRAINQVHDKLYLRNHKEGYDIYTGKGKKYDYSELESAQEMAIEAIEGNDMDRLSESVAVWEKWLEESNVNDRKSKVSDRVTAGLYDNLMVGYLNLKDFDKARAYAQKRIDIRSEMTVSRWDGAEGTLAYINDIDKALKNNAPLEVPSTPGEALDFVKELGRRRNMKDYDLMAVADKTTAFEEEYAQLIPVVKSTAKEEKATGGFDVASRMQPSTGGSLLTLSQLDDADLSGKAFPQEIADRQDIAIVYANFIGLTSLPDNIGNMKALKRLELRGNNLKEIPESIGDLTELKALALANNQLTTLPESIKKCTNLKTLVLKGNPISASELKKIASWLPAKCKIK